MSKSHGLLGAILFGAITVSACSPEAAKSLLNAATNVQQGTTKPASSSASGTAKDPAAEKLKDEQFAAFKAKVDAAAADPEKTLKLFIAAYSKYKKDAAFSKELMTLFMQPREGGGADFGDVERDPISRSGYRFIAARDNYWRELDKNPDTVLVHLKNATDADTANPEDGVLIDFDYKAAEKGLNGNRYKQYLFVNGNSGKRSRPVLLQKVGERWYAKEFSSIMIGI